MLLIWFTTTLTVYFPDDIEPAIRKKLGGDVNHYAREALAVQMYRDRKLTHGQLQRFLGVSSYEADSTLKKHGGVHELSSDELSAQVRASHLLRGKQ